MKYLPLLLLVSAQLGCTIIPTQHGKAIFGGDYTRISFSDGSVRFSADKATHSTAARVHWNGAGNIVAEAATAAIGLQGGNQVVGGAASVITPIVNRPTTRESTKP